jgi:phosphatidyl-myo-inositol alpha-mannosyltransferase
MKIALVSPYDFAYPGGVVHHITALEREFTKLGHDVRVIAPASKACSEFNDKFIPIGTPRAIPTSGSIARITLSLRLAKKIKTVLAREKFDIVHLHEPFMPMLCSAVLRFSKNVNVGTFHAAAGRPGYYFGWPISAIMIKNRAPKLAAKIAVSTAAQRYHKKWVRGDFQIIPNGIDLNIFTPKVAPLPEFCDGKINILFVGRLENRKGLMYLLRAFRHIKRKNPNLRLIVVGPGSLLRKRYELFVSRHRLTDVVFVGQVSQDMLPRYYRTADICCAPATGRESFGIVLLEAMAMGKPVVASSIEGYRCVVTNGIEGILVPPKNDKKLAEALNRLITDSALRQRMGINGLQKVQEYSWGKIASQILDCYAKILHGRELHRPILQGITSE